MKSFRDKLYEVDLMLMRIVQEIVFKEGPRKAIDALIDLKKDAIKTNNATNRVAYNRWYKLAIKGLDDHIGYGTSYRILDLLLPDIKFRHFPNIRNTDDPKTAVFEDILNTMPEGEGITYNVVQRYKLLKQSQAPSKV